MSESPQDEILERNVEDLLTRAHEPPRLETPARTRVLAGIKAGLPSEEPASPPKVTPLSMPRRQPSTWTGVLALAAVLGLIWAGIFFGGSGHNGAIGQVYENTEVRPMSVELADGSQALLRGDTKIEQVARREIRLLQGELLLEVEKDEEPFVVHTEHGRAVALGTRFSVRAGTQKILTAVVRGTVRIENDGLEAVLRAGEQGELSPDAAPQKTLGERLSHTLAWARDSIGQLDHQPLEPARRGNLIARDPRWQQSEWPLPIRKMTVDVHVEDGVARTTIDQTFFNHVGRQLEGVYSFPLPGDAAISRLAMYVDGKLMEGGIVERQRGRNVYENIVYQRRDPALLEWMKGNEFRVRVFPLPARTEKRIILSYTQELHSLYGAYRLKVPIPEVDLPVGEFDVRVHTEGSRYEIASESHRLESENDSSASYSGRKVEIGDDLLITLQEVEPQRSKTIAYRDGSDDYLMVRAHPTFTAPMEHLTRSWVALYDTSASRNPQELEAQATLLRRFLGEIDEDDRVAVVAFDTETRTMEGGLTRVRDLDHNKLDTFLADQARVAAGVTNLALGLDVASGLLAGEQNAPHVLYLGDGSITEGTTELEALRKRVSFGPTFVGVAVGDQVDQNVLQTMAEASGGLSISVSPGEDLAWRAFEVIAMLNSPRVLGVQATLLDSGGSSLSELAALPSATSIPHGECISVLTRGSELTQGRVQAVRLEGTLAGEPWSQTIELPQPKPQGRYLPRLWAKAQIDAWLRDSDTEHEAEITKLGMRHFLITPFTSLLVLENEKMYEQFEVTRPDAEGWAHYDAPQSIDVVTETAGTDPLALEPSGDQLLLRDPLAILQWPALQHSWAGPIGGEMTGGAWGVGGLGLIGAGRGGGGVGTIGIGLGNTRGFGSGGGSGSGWVVDDLTDLDASLIPAGATAENSEDAAFARNAEIVTTNEVSQLQTDFRRSVAAKATESLHKTGKGKSGSRARRRFMEGRSSNQFWSTRWGGSHRYGGSPGLPHAAALHYATDPRLDDLTNFVPAMFADEYDHAREAMLVATIDRKPTPVPDDARTLIEAARAGTPTGRYRLGEGGEMSIDDRGRITTLHRTPEGLREEVRYDTEHVYALYPELSLAVRRRVGPTSPLLLGVWAPWVMPPADHLARFYTVELADHNTIRLTTANKDSEPLEFVLDERRRVVTIRRGDFETRFEYASDSLTIIEGDEKTKLERLGGPQGFDPVDEADFTVVSLPLRPANHWDAELAKLPSGSAAWRTAQRQRMAAAAAMGDSAAIARAARELVAGVDQLRPGELVLLSGGASGLDKDTVNSIVERSGDAKHLAAYVRASYDQRRSWTARPFDKLVRKDDEGLLPALTLYRSVLARIDYRGARGEKTKILRFVERHGDSNLAYVLVQRSAQYLGWNRSQDAAALWKALAERPRWKTLALYAAGQTLSQRGKYADAAELFEESINSALDDGQPPIFDWNVRQAFQAGRGQASFQLQWSRWRSKVLASDDLTQRVAFVAAARQLGENDDLHRVVTTTKAESLDDLGEAVALVDQLLAGQLTDDAWLITKRLLTRHAEDAAVLDRASVVSEMQGRVADAAGYLERAMKLEVNDGVPLSGLRNDYRRLIGLHTRLAQSELSTDDAARHRTEVLRIASEWRREDPDNAEIDRLCAALYVDNPERAWRYLSSIIERHPAEGSAYSEVAQALEREGQLRRADLLWQRAFDVEPTNPTWALRRAQNLAAFGHDTSAVELLETIEDGDWQDRFSGIEWQAKELRRQLDRDSG
jgi:ferric-dicitrate binding protein FerR (iron transport regulator)/tetratricopeptide (TPR) repeat protein